MKRILILLLAAVAFLVTFLCPVVVWIVMLVYGDEDDMNPAVWFQGHWDSMVYFFEYYLE